MASITTSETIPAPMKRDLFFSKQVDQETMQELTEKIIEINDSDKTLEKLYSIYGLDYSPKPIKIFIDSYGGQVYQCFGLLSIIENSITPIYTIVTGAAMSCGFMILICGHKRFAYKLATPLYHSVSHGAYGQAKALEESLVETKRLQNKVEEITLRRTKITKKKLKDVYEKKFDWYMTSDEALKLGVVDEIL